MSTWYFVQATSASKDVLVRKGVVSDSELAV